MLQCLVERHGQLVTKRRAARSASGPGPWWATRCSRCAFARSGKALGDEVGRAPVRRHGTPAGIAGSSPTSPTSTRDRGVVRRPGGAGADVAGRSRASYRGSGLLRGSRAGPGQAPDRARGGVARPAPDRLRDRRAWHRQDRCCRGVPRARPPPTRASGSREASASRRTGRRSHIRRCSMPSAGSAARLRATGWSPSCDSMRPPGSCRCHGSSVRPTATRCTGSCWAPRKSGCCARSPKRSRR